MPEQSEVDVSLAQSAPPPEPSPPPEEEAETPAPSAPETAPSTVETAETVPTGGQVLSVGRTSGDRYVVRTELPEGGYKQSLMTAEEIRAVGGIVPVGGEQYVQRYAGVPLYGEEDKKLSTVYQFASDLVTEQGISEAEARRITELALREPDAPELQTIPLEVKQRIVSDIAPKGYQLLEGAGITPQIVSTEAVRKLTRLTPGTEEYHDALQSLRLVSREARYIPPEMIEKAQIALEPFITAKGVDIASALDAGVPESYLEIYLGKKDIQAIKAQIAEIKDFRRENMQLASGEWVSIEEWNRAFSAMSEETASRYQKIALDPKRGLAVMGRVMERDYGQALQEQKEFEKAHVQLADDRWVPRFGQRGAGGEVMTVGFESLDVKYQEIGKTQGYDAMAKAIKAEQERIIPEKVVIAPELPKTWINVRTGEKITDVEKRALGMDIKADEYVRDISSPVVREVMADMIPVLGTIRYTKRASKDGFTPGEIAWLATYVALDIATIAIGFGAAGAGARAAVGAGRMARVAGAARGLGQFALAEIKAPYTMVRHPVQTAKAVYRPFATLISPRAVPLAAVETSYSTLRIPVKADAPAVRAIREAVTDAAIHGRTAKATIGGTSVSLEPTLLKKIGAPVAVHTTPDIRPYMTGTIVRPGREGGLYLSPDVHTRFSFASGFGDMPKGGIKGALLIRDEKVLQAIAPSRKLYRGVAEIEALLPAGTKLPRPSQTLFTRDIAGNKLTLLVIGKPFTASQIMKLKWSGALENVYQLFDPAIYISRSERAGIKALDQMIDLTKQRTNLAKQIEAYRKAGDVKRLTKAERTMARLTQRIDSLRPKVQSGLGRRAVGRVNIVFAQYTDKGILERWEDIAGGRADIGRINGGTIRRLPGIDARRVGIPLHYPPPRPLARVSIPEREEYIPSREPAPRAPGITPPERPPIRPPDRRIPPRIPPTLVTTIRVPPRVPPPIVPPRVPPRVPPPEVPPRVPPRVPPPRVPPPEVPPRVPPRVPPPIVPPRVPPSPPIVTRMERIGEQAIIPSGSVAWRQGIFWKYIPPPYNMDKAITLPKGITPMGAIKTHLRTPKETIQKIGETDALVPESVSKDLGAFDLEIRNYAQDIEFVAGGERTNVGQSLESTTQGMSIPSVGISRPEIGTVKPAASVSRTAIAATTLPDRVKRDTTLQGINRPEVVEERKRIARERIESAEIRQVEPDADDLGAFFDEDPEWLSSFNGESKPVNRTKMSRKAPRRTKRRDNPPTMVRGVRL